MRFPSAITQPVLQIEAQFFQNGPISPKMVNFARTFYIIYENCAKKSEKID